uniref:Uncharacterized protein n=1 Tax=Neogobius melanostomus TaxID=47308 RepID=A0A8C6UMR9_9GOBI
MYFEGSPPANQFLCRAYLCQGQLECPPAAGSVEDVEKAADYFLKAIEVAKREPSLHCLVFNASVLYVHTVRPSLQRGRSAHLVPSLRQVLQGLEELNDPDHDWRAQLMMQLLKCYIDAGEMEEAVMFAKATQQFVKSHTAHLFPELFSLLVTYVILYAFTLAKTIIDLNYDFKIINRQFKGISMLLDLPCELNLLCKSNHKNMSERLCC